VGVGRRIIERTELIDARRSPIAKKALSVEEPARKSKVRFVRRAGRKGSGSVSLFFVDYSRT
jgi:hypothetical protein